MLRAWRAALDLLNEWEATVLQVRFGIDGGRPRRLPEAARQLGVRPQNFAEVEQHALRKLDQAPPTRPLAIHLANLREEVDRGDFAPPPPSAARGPVAARGFQPSMEPGFVQPPPLRSAPRPMDRPRDDRQPPRERFDERPRYDDRGRFDDRRPPRHEGPPRDRNPPRAAMPPPPPPQPPPMPPPRVIPPDLAPWTYALLLLTERETDVVVLRAGLRQPECPSISSIAKTLGITRKRAYELHEHAVERLQRKPAGALLAQRLEEVARASEEGRPIPPLVVPPMPAAPLPVPSVAPASATTQAPTARRPPAPPLEAARPSVPPPPPERAVASAPPVRRSTARPEREPEQVPEQLIVVRSNSDHDEAVAAVEEALAALRFAAEECRDGMYERLVEPLTELARVVERGAAELRGSGPRG
ncbi:MAG: hypothetical protein IPN34_13780 [Planctomycetes bacterium]|nr:hypothetical protein [Planctomycetota bacterium]